MRIKYLGTAAAEGIPAIFCSCDLCVRANEARGKDIRSRSQILVNDDLLIDFPPDSFYHKIAYNIDMSKIKSVLITHAHADHYYPMDFDMRGEPYAHKLPAPPLTIFGNATVMERFSELTRFEMKDNVLSNLALQQISPFQTIEKDGYTITAFPAVHTKMEECLIYLVSFNGKNMLHFCDSGILPDDVYDKMKDMGVKIDLISFDCTYGYFKKGGGRHMGVLDNLDERDKMAKRGLISRDTKSIITHFSHNNGLLHDELVEKVKYMNLTVAFDGMEITI